MEPSDDRTLDDQRRALRQYDTAWEADVKRNLDQLGYSYLKHRLFGDIPRGQYIFRSNACRNTWTMEWDPDLERYVIVNDGEDSANQQAL
jgi:hypothetical protein